MRNTIGRFKDNKVNQHGITLIALIITIIILLILSGIAAYSGIEAIDNTKRTKFIAELKIMQSYVNRWYEDIKPNESDVSSEKTIDDLWAENMNKKFGLAPVNAKIGTNDSISTKVSQTLTAAGISIAPGNFYLLEDAQKQALGVEGVSQSVLISVKDRKVVSYLGLKYKDKMYYTIDNLDSENGIDAIYNVGYTAPSADAPTFTLKGFRLENQKSAKISLNITYNAKYVNKGTVYYGIIKDNSNRASSYSSTEDNSFVITENGKYDIFVKDAAGNESAHVIKYFSKDANSPKLTDGMIPIKWVEGSGDTPSNWVVCDKDDIDWFSYDHKLWANIMLSDGTYKADTVQVGQVVAEADLGSMYVWIPRYAYQMPSNSYVYGTTANPELHTIDVTFLNKNTNRTSTGKEFPKATVDVNTMQTAIVHPAFTFGDKELEGLWIAKFEASGTNEIGTPVGNCADTTLSERNVVQPDSSTIIKSLPNVISWRDIQIGNIQYYCMSISGLKKANYGITNTNVNSHLIKNSEWGAVAYLSYSKYGELPKINSSGSKTTGKSSNWDYNIYTGQGPKTGEKNEDGTITAVDEGKYIADISSHGYSTKNGILASTTGNITGIYDMNGGSHEFVASYLDNTNHNLVNFGKTTAEVSGSVINYFNSTSRELNNEFIDFWDSYEVSQEERTNKIKVIIDGIEQEIPQAGTSGLWRAEKMERTYQDARKRLTEANFNNMSKYKGIGVNEVSNEFSFYTTINYLSKISGTNNYETKQMWQWFKNVDTAISRASGTSTAAEYARTWDNDYVLIGHASNPFIVRGGAYTTGIGAGVFYSKIGSGDGSYANGFRSTLVL